MNILEYIEEFYPIRDRVERLIKDPYTLVKESDDLPFDEIKYIDGKIQKVVECADGEYIPVFDLLLYDKEDVLKMQDSAFKEMYLAYIDQIDIKSVSIQEIMSAVREYEKHKADLKEKLS